MRKMVKAIELFGNKVLIETSLTYMTIKLKINMITEYNQGTDDNDDEEKPQSRYSHIPSGARHFMSHPVSVVIVTHIVPSLHLELKMLHWSSHICDFWKRQGIKNR